MSLLNIIAVIFAIGKCNCYSIPYTSYPYHVGGETESFKQHVQCGGSVNYNCVNQDCDVQCGDGTRVRRKSLNLKKTMNIIM